MMGYGYGMTGFGWIWMMLIPVLFIALIVYVALRFTDGSKFRYDGRSQDSDRAIEILNQKYASGEISEDEYKRKKELLRQ